MSRKLDLEEMSFSDTFVEKAAIANKIKYTETRKRERERERTWWSQRSEISEIRHIHQ